MMSPALNALPASFSLISLGEAMSLRTHPCPCPGIPGKGHWADTVTIKVRKRNNAHIFVSLVRKSRGETS